MTKISLYVKELFVNGPWRDRAFLMARRRDAVMIRGASVAGRNLLDGWRHRRHATSARLVTVAPPPEVDPHSAAALWANLHGALRAGHEHQVVGERVLGALQPP